MKRNIASIFIGRSLKERALRHMARRCHQIINKPCLEWIMAQHPPQDSTLTNERASLLLVSVYENSGTELKVCRYFPQRGTQKVTALRLSAHL